MPMSIDTEELFGLFHITHELENKTHKGDTWQTTSDDSLRLR